MTDKERWLAATIEERANCEFSTRQHPEKISSHSGWYHGKWETDTCGCGEKMRVPAGKKGCYRCNNCANRAEGIEY